MARMIARLPSDLDVSEGSYLWDALAPVAAEVAQMKLEAQEILKRAFVQYSYGSYVDIRVADRGVVRKPAYEATGQVQVTGTPGTLIPVGTEFSTTTDLVSGTPAVEFVSATQAVIDAGGVGLIDIKAWVPGISGNVPANTIVQLIAPPISGVTAVTNPEATSGGMSEEGDEELIYRYLELVQKPPGTGNKGDYVHWAKGVAGVGDAISIPLWNGPGTVKVVIVDGDGAPANSTLVQQVQDIICPVPGIGAGQAPVGANVVVTAPIIVAIDVSATLIYTSGYDPATVNVNVEAAIDTFIKKLKIGEYVRHVAIANAIYDTPGVADYYNLFVNGTTDNINMDRDAKAVLRAVVLT